LGDTAHFRVAQDRWFVGNRMTTAGAAHLMRLIGLQAHRVVRNGGSVLVFTDWRMVPAIGPAIESAGIRWQNTVVWDKGSVGTGRGFRASHEMILHFTKGVAEYHSAREGNVLRVPRVPVGQRAHPTQKPVELVRRMLQVVLPPDGLVVDPFLGSGTTLRAAKDLGQRAIGIDIDERWCEVTVQRLGQMPLRGMEGTL